MTYFQIEFEAKKTSLSKLRFAELALDDIKFSSWPCASKGEKLIVDIRENLLVCLHKINKAACLTTASTS